MHSAYKYLAPTLLAFGLAACGGGGGGGVGTVSYSGKTTPADFSTLSNTQKKEVVDSAASVYGAAEESSDLENMQSPMPFGAGVSTSSNSVPNVVALTLKLANRGDLANLPVGASADVSEMCTGGGSATASGSGDEKSGSSTMKFNNCAYGDGGYSMTFNGSIAVKYSEKSYKIEYKDFSLKGSGDYAYSSLHNGFYDLDGIGWGDGDRFDEDSSFNSLIFTAKWSIASEYSYTVEGKNHSKKVSSSGELSCTKGKCTITTAVKDVDGKTYKVTFNDDNSITFYNPDLGSFSLKDFDDLEACEDGKKAPFEGSFTLEDSKGNKLYYKATSCDAEPSYTK
jgi:hypothetical protein